MELTYSQFYLYVFLGQIVLGIILGLVPLLVGKNRGEARLGKYGFIATLVACALSPLLGLIAMSVALWMIIKKKGSAAAGTGDDASVH